jgi:hypothetical protein
MIASIKLAVNKGVSRIAEMVRPSSKPQPAHKPVIKVARPKQVDPTKAWVALDLTVQPARFVDSDDNEELLRGRIKKHRNNASIIIAHNKRSK